MNMLHVSERRRFAASSTEPSGRYDVTLRLSVEDIGRLWRAAVAHALTMGDYSDEDMEDMLGPIEAPNVADCLAMLVGPRALAGCRFEAFAIASAQPAARAGGRRREGTDRTVRLDRGKGCLPAETKPRFR